MTDTLLPETLGPGGGSVRAWVAYPPRRWRLDRRSYLRGLINGITLGFLLFGAALRFHL